MAPGARALDGVSVLVVEDDEDSREMLCLGLTLAGARVSGVASAHEAWAALEQSLPDVLLTDIGLPDEDGLSLIRRIRRLPPERGGRVPAVALTAYTLRDEADDPIRAGFQIHLQKPIESRVLVEAVADLARG